MASDSSESPLVLTPESTGTIPVESSAASSAAAAKKARRQTAFYPNVNSSNKQQKPFSRSAAKRESVMALGSIEHLQHFFTKTGLAAKKNPLTKPHHGLVPAIGGKGHTPLSPSLTDIGDFQMPPSPAVPTGPRPTIAPHIRTYEVDPESLLPGVIEDLISVAHAWKLERIKGGGAADLNERFDVLEVLKITTRAIRSARNYLLSLPDEGATSIEKKPFRPKHLGPGASSSTHVPTIHSTSGASENDSVALMRKASLDVLTVLRTLEDNCRLPLSHEAYDAHSDDGHSQNGGESSPSTSNLPAETSSQSDPDASVAFSLVQVQGRFESVPVWEDLEESFAFEPEEKREIWDDRLVLGSGWLYKQDVKLSDLERERLVVGEYLDTVDAVLFEGGRGATEERGWDRVRRQREGRASSRAARGRRATSHDRDRERTKKNSYGLLEVSASDGGRRRVSTGMLAPLMRGVSLSEEPEDMEGITEEGEDEEDLIEVDDDELPEWANRKSWEDDELGRLHSLLAYFLPSSLLPVLGPHNDRTALLSSLSSGQLLCVAYNACVRKSKKPWGFVSKDGIHDIIALEKAAEANGEEQSGKKVWTFRRTDNLRLFVGAMKLRYLLPIQTPSQPLTKPLPALPVLPVAPGGSRPLPIPPSAQRLTNQPPSVASTPRSTPLSSPSAQTFHLGNLKPRNGEPTILFDAKVVARKDEGWDDMLANVLFKWVERVVEERRVQQI